MGEPRLFRVVVLGGVSLIGGATGMVSCSGPLPTETGTIYDGGDYGDQFAWPYEAGDIDANSSDGRSALDAATVDGPSDGPVEAGGG